MTRIGITIFLMILLAACQNGDATEANESDQMAEALKPFETSKPSDVSAYLGTWSTYKGEGSGYEQLRLQESEDGYEIQYDLMDYDGRVLKSMLGPLDGLRDGQGVFDYNADRYGNNGQLEVHLQADGVQFYNKVDGETVKEIFFNQKISR
ncbi:hypothetical protein ABID56_001422 [Alkalibacillus flavidus]|uniref:Lipocalin-like domain-containing protein n=1 Tax=Alkalibacillus flavidus TaxID=546021 RepID=A0ABV2KW53_9BACI